MNTYNIQTVNFYLNGGNNGESFSSLLEGIKHRNKPVSLRETVEKALEQFKKEMEGLWKEKIDLFNQIQKENEFVKKMESSLTKEIIENGRKVILQAKVEPSTAYLEKLEKENEEKQVDTILKALGLFDGANINHIVDFLVEKAFSFWLTKDGNNEDLMKYQFITNSFNAIMKKKWEKPFLQVFQTQSKAYRRKQEEAVSYSHWQLYGYTNISQKTFFKYLAQLSIIDFAQKYLKIKNCKRIYAENSENKMASNLRTYEFDH